MAKDTVDQDPELIAMSYDGILAIKTRIARIGDVPIPKRGGATVPELLFYVGTFIVNFICFTGFVLPILQILDVRLPVWVILGVIFGLPVLYAQRLTTPMAHHKTIRESVRSKLRRLFDEPVHRRGKPAPRKAVPATTPVAHYQREWQIAADAPGADHERYLPLVSERVQAHRGQAAFDAAPEGLADLQVWRANRMRLNRDLEVQDRRNQVGQRRANTDLAISRYGTVHLDEETPTLQELTS